MAIRNIVFTADNFYHIYNRGNSKQNIFLDDLDYQRFINLLYCTNGENQLNYRQHIIKPNISPFDFNRGNPLVDICAWVLMPNHFHLLLKQNKDRVFDNQSIVAFVHKLSLADSMYFNTKYSRTGSLFEGRFKAKLVDDDNYFQHLFSYIHLNPVKLIQPDWNTRGVRNQIEACNFAQAYTFSSFQDWLSVLRPEHKIITRDVALEFLPKEFNLKDNLMAWLSKDRVFV